MESIAIVEQGRSLSRCLTGLARPVRSLGPAGGQAALVVVAPDSCPLPQGPLRCRVLLLPGRLAPLAGAVQAGWVVSYGLDGRDTLTLSSLSPRRPCLALQRELVTLTGRCLEPQEIPLPPWPAGLSPHLLLAWAGVWLLVGTPPAAMEALPLPGAEKKPCPFPEKGL